MVVGIYLNGSYRFLRVWGTLDVLESVDTARSAQTKCVVKRDVCVMSGDLLCVVSVTRRRRSS